MFLLRARYSSSLSEILGILCSAKGSQSCSMQYKYYFYGSTHNTQVCDLIFQSTLNLNIIPLIRDKHNSSHQQSLMHYTRHTSFFLTTPEVQKVVHTNTASFITGKVSYKMHFLNISQFTFCIKNDKSSKEKGRRKRKNL